MSEISLFTANDNDRNNVDVDADDSTMNDDSRDSEIDVPVEPVLRRSKRVSVPNQRYQHLHAKPDQLLEYTHETARVIAETMNYYNYVLIGRDDNAAHSFMQT